MTSKEKNVLGLAAYAFVNTSKQSVSALIVLCADHATEALAKLERLAADGKQNTTLRRIQKDWSPLGDDIVLALRNHEARGENRCTRCSAPDWTKVKVWYGFDAVDRRQLERAAGLGKLGHVVSVVI